MFYAVGYYHEALPDGRHDPNGTGWWERICGPQSGPNQCSIALGRFLTSHTSKNPRTHMVYEAYRIIPTEELPDFGLPIPSEAWQQAQIAGGSDK